MEGTRKATISDLPGIMRTARFLIDEIGYIIPAALRAAIQRDELLMHYPSWSFCHYHRRKDGVAVVYEIAVPMSLRGRGIGKSLLSLIDPPIVLKCPADNASNRFYEAVGFKLLRMEYGKSKRLNVWGLGLPSPPSSEVSPAASSPPLPSAEPSQPD